MKEEFVHPSTPIHPPPYPQELWAPFSLFVPPGAITCAMATTPEMDGWMRRIIQLDGMRRVGGGGEEEGLIRLSEGTERVDGRVGQMRSNNLEKKNKVIIDPFFHLARFGHFQARRCVFHSNTSYLA